VYFISELGMINIVRNKRGQSVLAFWLAV